ncbi:MAG: hypothetical protein KC910_05035 [Candidatus Eremiobacteraeota bacterium]|nr:hypothetical protein [Candidatus Eremiobacteraeota bacterium]
MTRIFLGALALLTLANFLAGPAISVAQGSGVALAPATSSDGHPACWIAVGNKLYFVTKDDTTVLKVKASGSL